jgi:hypothetical protein
MRNPVLSPLPSGRSHYRAKVDYGHRSPSMEGMVASERTSNQERKMAFRSDWKSADQLQADIDAGSIPPAHHLIIDLWRRVEELQAHIDELERQMKEKNSN